VANDGGRILAAATQDLGDIGQIASVHMTVRDRIRRAILRGEIPAGARLLQADLAKQMGVSVTPVREALRDLSTEGLVDFNAFAGAVVHQPTAQELNDIYEIRAHISILATRKGVESITSDELAEAERLIKLMDSDERLEDFVEHNRAFHHLIDDAGRNSQISLLMRRLADASALYVNLSMPHRTNQLAGANREHRRILGAYKKRSIEDALALTLEHMNSTLVAALQFLNESASAKLVEGEGPSLSGRTRSQTAP
jgi:DNA-binding GntR family transcriptional regulator